MIRLDTSQARARLKATLDKLSKQQAAKAQRLALNDAAKWGRTQISRDIRDRYNIPVGRINDSNPKKGLRVLFANTANPDARITGGHIPVNIATLQNTKMVTETNKMRNTRTILKKRNSGGLLSTFSTAALAAKAEGGSYRQAFLRALAAENKKALTVSVEVVKGQRKTIPTAFMLGVTKGQKGAKFTGSKAVIFARGSWGKPDFDWSKKRMPIAPLHTVSIATAALHSNVQKQWAPKIKTRAESELYRQAKRLLQEAANQ